MHIALNGWFWDTPFTGSGQYVRQLVAALRQIAPALRLTLVMPGTTPDDVPPGVDAVAVRLPFGGQPGKVYFEQRGFPAAVGRLGADIAHVPYWAGPLRSPARLIITVHDVIPLSLPVYQGGIGARLYFSLVSATARGASHLITDSEFSRGEIVARIGVPGDRVTAIPLACAPEFHPRTGAERDPA
ncbi:MAG: glycosyltransferase, partial [Anaerolineae bacterium]|nr:glycosyltransferase [Anaerolineae bacterium]